MTPSALQSFRQAGADVRQALRADTVTVGSVEYDCAAVVGSIKPEQDLKTMSTRNVQHATVEILKTGLSTCPSASAKVRFHGIEWFIEGLGGQDNGSLVWKLKLKRIITKAG